MEVLIADLARVTDAVASVKRRAIIIGESFGGALALVSPSPGLSASARSSC